MLETSDNHPMFSKNCPILGSGWIAPIVSPQSTNAKITLGKLGPHRRRSSDKPSKSPTNSSYQCRRRGAKHPIIIRRITEIIRFQLRTPLESSELPGGRPNRKIIVKRCPVIVNSAAWNPSRIHRCRAPIYQFATDGPSILARESCVYPRIGPLIQPRDSTNLPITYRFSPKNYRFSEGTRSQIDRESTCENPRIDRVRPGETNGQRKVPKIAGLVQSYEAGRSKGDGRTLKMRLIEKRGSAGQPIYVLNEAKKP